VPPHRLVDQFQRIAAMIDRLSSAAIVAPNNRMSSPTERMLS
jgi:hypothetical protein